ncbi:mitotic checkpoint regulator, MAD2B-interacting-domain-containing protein [Exophiala viscosa]|uniref:mitotic checkpoint regulator, MAD2B-interacting-domain-containing protein n=1 Tax=Exophiala viscosa TaxID=2486360 RepID=UPI00218D85CA|nr:mitotic checkpoint regulator, MAD2B-interacting-domain-containing protein [Exophiala viscosa]
MSLVTYSDSEGSDDETPQTKAVAPKPQAAATNRNFTVNKANPRKIQVKLNGSPTNGDDDGEPAPKRPRVGAGAFSGFNSMLPAPKRDADAKSSAKPAARKVFSLKTGAEPGFSREGDAELRHLFAEQDAGSGRQDGNKEDDTIPAVPKKTDVTGSSTAEVPLKGNPFMFKPLSVARNNKKPKRKTDPSKAIASKPSDVPVLASSTTIKTDTTDQPEPAPAPKKVSLFGLSSDPEPHIPLPLEDEEDEIVEVLDDPIGDEDYSAAFGSQGHAVSTSNQAQSLDTIASDLNLSKAERRQLFGRNGRPGGTAMNVVNFNTDEEYAANEALRATGEQIQHNPVRSIAPGKHSLKQLVSAATGQKDALEESFATGKRNKKEAGSKYGW